MFFKSKFYFILLLQLIVQNNLLNATIKEDIQALTDLRSVIQNLAARASQLGLVKPFEETPEYIIQPFRRWDKKDYSVIQIHVLDQFLKVEQFLKQKKINPADIEKLPTIFKHPEEIESLSRGHEIRAKGAVEITLDTIQKTKTLVSEELKKGEFSPHLNIGGGEESCGYHAIKNALYIILRMGYEPGMFLTLNDPIEANNLFGTYDINKLLDIKPLSIDTIEEGPWRKTIKEYRVSIKEHSIANSLESAKKSIDIIEENIKKLPQIIENFKKSIEKEKMATEIKKIWDTIATKVQRINYEANEANLKSKEIATRKARDLSIEISEIASKAKDLLESTKKTIPAELLNLPTAEEEYQEEEEEDDGFDIDEEEEEEYNLTESSESEDSDIEEEHEELEEEIKHTARPNESSLSLEQSEKEGNFLSAEELDFLYDSVKEKYNLPESTTAGTMELGVERIEGGQEIDPEVAQELFDHIITNFSKDSSKQHVVFIGGGGHWATMVIRIINKKLYYIIADSTNEPRYGVDLKQKGIFITKGIQKIIDGTKNSLLKLMS